MLFLIILSLQVAVALGVIVWLAVIFGLGLEAAVTRSHRTQTYGFTRKLWRSEVPVDWAQAMAVRDRANAYLRRIVELTGAKRKGVSYILDVGQARFRVRERYIKRMPIANGSRISRAQTCYFPPNQVMPAAEKIATVLLQLKANPSLFDRWATRRGCYKASGELFIPS